VAHPLVSVQLGRSLARPTRASPWADDRREFTRAGRRTLAVDCDAQAHLTHWLLGRADQLAADLEAIVVGGADPAAAVRPTRVAGLDALPATPRLAHIARALAADGTRIARALGRLRPRYDAMVLDLPSTLSDLTVAASAAAKA
jgi:chromosome partitioning protein